METCNLSSSLSLLFLHKFPTPYLCSFRCWVLLRRVWHLKAGFILLSKGFSFKPASGTWFLRFALSYRSSVFKENRWRHLFFLIRKSVRWLKAGFILAILLQTGGWTWFCGSIGGHWSTSLSFTWNRRIEALFFHAPFTHLPFEDSTITHLLFLLWGWEEDRRWKRQRGAHICVFVFYSLVFITNVVWSILVQNNLPINFMSSFRMILEWLGSTRKYL